MVSTNINDGIRNHPITDHCSRCCQQIEYQKKLRERDQQYFNNRAASLRKDAEDLEEKSRQLKEKSNHLEKQLADEHVKKIQVVEALEKMNMQLRQIINKFAS